MKSGIYLIQCGDKKYVGQAIDISKRWKSHEKELKNNTHNNHYLQNVWNKHSEQFEFIVLEKCDVNSLNEREEYWINKLNTLSPNGMNLRQAGSKGIASEETKLKMSIAQTGKTASEETRKKLSESHKGQYVSEETRKKISLIHIGAIFSDSRKQKISEARKGKTHSEETKNKISETKKGKTVSEETKKKLSEARKGKSSGMLGKTASEETRKKLSEATRAYWANKKKGG